MGSGREDGQWQSGSSGEHLLLIDKYLATLPDRIDKLCSEETNDVDAEQEISAAMEPEAGYRRCAAPPASPCPVP